MLRRALQSKDLDGANKIKQVIDSANAASLPPAVSESIVGAWVFRSEGWSGNREFKPDGSVDAGVDGAAKWKIDGKELRVEYGTGDSSATFDLPVRQGKLSGKTAKGRPITAEKLTKP